MQLSCSWRAECHFTDGKKEKGLKDAAAELDSERVWILFWKAGFIKRHNAELMHH